MSAAAKLLRQRSQVLICGGLVPRIGSEGDLGAQSRGADADRIDALAMQQVGNELVIPFEIQVAHVEEDDPVPRFAPLPQNVNRPAVALEQRTQVLRNDRQLD